MQANLEEIQNLVAQLDFRDKVRLLEYLAPEIAQSAPTVDAALKDTEVVDTGVVDTGGSDTGVADTVASTIEPSSAYASHPAREAMRREVEAYHRLHDSLISTYLGQYVAIFEGKIVDHDPDPVTLHKRVKANFPYKVVLSRKVTRDPEPVLRMRSPRLERSS